MSGFAAIVSWKNTQTPAASIDRLLDGLPHRALEVRQVIGEKNWALGFAGRFTEARERQLGQPYWDAYRGLALVGDVRLDNREELNRLLQTPSPPVPTDEELLVLAYERWDSGLAERLDGDFAFVLWDARRNRLIAARDPFGTRPLFYHANADRLALASTVEQLLQLPDVKADLEDRVVRDFLLSDYQLERETFFQGIYRLRPGHWIEAGSNYFREIRYWRPPTREISWPRREDYEQEFRRHLRRAVSARLSSDHPLAVQLSGGLDSSAIVCLADEIYLQDPDRRPPLSLLSTVYPGLDCDESSYIDAVADRVAFPSLRRDGTAEVSDSPIGPRAAHPYLESPFSGFADENLPAEQAGACVVLSGLGGDQLLFERGIFRDLAVHGQFLTLWREARLAPRYSTQSAGFFWRDALAQLIPSWTRRWARRLWPRPVSSHPWFGPQLRACSPAPVETKPGPFLSHTQEMTWTWLTSPNFWWQLELQGEQAARRGLQLRFPFLDASLTQFVLAIPYEFRHPHGQMKFLLRNALADVLPPLIARRSQVTTFESYFRLCFSRSLKRFREIFTQGPWRSEPYVNRLEMQKSLEILDVHATGLVNWVDWRILWNAAHLELWMRNL